MIYKYFYRKQKIWKNFSKNFNKLKKVLKNIF